MKTETAAPDKKIRIRGARVHNLEGRGRRRPTASNRRRRRRVRLGQISLALGVLYAEGSRRYSGRAFAYTRRRMTQAARPQVDEVRYVPAALALRQRPGVPGIRSTFGTGTELLNSLRLMFSRLAAHSCPNGHLLEPTLDVAAERELVCPVCGGALFAPSAEELSFNSRGACAAAAAGREMCARSTGTRWCPDESLTIDEGAVAPWNFADVVVMTDVCRAMGVRTDVPFRDLTAREKDIVYNGPAEKRHILYKAKNSNQAGELDFTYYNATYTVENALAKAKDEGLKARGEFLREDVCPDCGGTRLSEAAARGPRLGPGGGGAMRCLAALDELRAGVPGVSSGRDASDGGEHLRRLARAAAARAGAGLLTLRPRRVHAVHGRAAADAAFARVVRNRTTGVLMRWTSRLRARIPPIWRGCAA